MTDLVLFAALESGWVVLILNEWVHAIVLWHLDGDIILKLCNWMHWDLVSSLLCNGDVRHWHIFVCNLGRTRSILGCSVVYQLPCSAALLYLLFRIQISKKGPKKYDNLTQSFELLYVSVLTPDSRLKLLSDGLFFATGELLFWKLEPDE